MNVHSVVARALADHGVDTVIGLIGDANLFVVDDFVRQQRMTFVPVANEASHRTRLVGVLDRWLAAQSTLWRPRYRPEPDRSRPIGLEVVAAR